LLRRAKVTRTSIPTTKLSRGVAWSSYGGAFVFEIGRVGCRAAHEVGIRTNECRRSRGRRCNWTTCRIGRWPSRWIGCRIAYRTGVWPPGRIGRWSSSRIGGRPTCTIWWSLSSITTIGRTRRPRNRRQTHHIRSLAPFILQKTGPENGVFLVHNIFVMLSGPELLLDATSLRRRRGETDGG